MTNKSQTIAPGDTVEYKCVAGVIRVKVLKIKPNGKLILNTRVDNTLLTPNKNKVTAIRLAKNVSVPPNRVKKI